MKNEKPTSRNIPLPIQREVRKRCGFGCVICGLPLYEYDHLKGWANVKRHLANEITLLCDKHHKERTNELLPIEHVIQANNNPYNLRAGVSKPYDLHFLAKEAEIEIGGNVFIAEDTGEGAVLIPLIIDDVPLVSFTIIDNHLLLNLLILDETNNKILYIKDNQVNYSVGVWDIQFVGRKLTIREDHRQILIKINFQPPNKVIIEKGCFRLNGVEVLVHSNKVLVTNNSLEISECFVKNATCGLIIGGKLELFGLGRIQDVPRYSFEKREVKV